MPTESAEHGKKWTPGKIRQLRKRYSESQTQFGLRIFAASPEYAQKRISLLETGEAKVSAAIARHLERLDDAS